MILFYLSEAVRSIKYAKTSFILTTVSLTISVLLVLFSFTSVKFSNYYSSYLKSNIKVNVFISDLAKENDYQKLFSDLKNKSYASEVVFISKDEAAELFIKETGEDFKKILDYNPLPASFVLKLYENYAISDSITKIVKQLSEIDGVDEVIFKEGFVYKLLDIINKVKIYLFISTALFSLIALYLIYATIKLIIHSRLIDFETMKLVGAKLSTIKIPVLLNGLFSGIISGILVYSFAKICQNYLTDLDVIKHIFNVNNFDYLFIIFLTGPILVLLVSVFTLRKVSLKI